MDFIPFRAILLVFTVDGLIIGVLSVFLALVIAKAVGSSPWLLVLVGLLLPVIGPLVWALVAVARDSSVASVQRVQSRRLGLFAASGALGVAAVLFLVAAALPWGEVAGAYDKYVLVGDAAASDSGVGLVSMVGTALVLAAALVVVLRFSAWRRVAVVAAVVGAGWLLLTVNGVIVFSAVNDVTDAVAGLSGGRAGAGVAPRGGLWLTMAASFFAIAAAVVLAALPREEQEGACAYLVPAASPATSSWRPESLAPQTPGPQRSFDYGDGF